MADVNCVDPTAAERTNPTGKISLQMLEAFPLTSFGPIFTLTTPGSMAMSMNYVSLLQTNSAQQLVPYAAELPTISADGLTITYKLREDLKWSDGEPLTADDVVYTYSTIANPATAASAGGDYKNVEGVKEVTDGTATTISGFSAPDPHTFQIKLLEPNIGFVALTAPRAFILPEHILKDIPLADLQKDKFFSSPTVSAGPFKFVENLADQYAHFEQNPDFFCPAKIKDVYMVVASSDTATAQLVAGEIDVVNQVVSTDVPTVKEAENLTIAEVVATGHFRMLVNLEKPYLQDPRVRQAILYSLDRESIVSQALGGYGRVVNSIFLGDALPTDLEQYPYDPEKAKQLLADAGWDPNQEVSLMWSPGNRDQDTVMTVLEQALTGIGMKVKIEQVSGADDIARLQSGDYDLRPLRGGNYGTDPWSVYPYYGCDQWYPEKGSNISRYCNEDFDKIMKEANQTVDQAARMALYQQAARILNKETVTPDLYMPVYVTAYNKKLHGFDPANTSGGPVNLLGTGGIWNWTMDA